ncbi:MAG: hypothetical protein M3271_02445 [Actinomycetota bacterium]|nr:hypothetical protein [Actinomycetota bacterium]
MNPLLKKVLAAVAIKEGIEKIQEMRRPKPSLWSRISPVAIVATLGGALFYLKKKGKLGPVVGQVKDRVGGSSPEGAPRRDAEGNGSGAWKDTSPTTPEKTPV